MPEWFMMGLDDYRAYGSPRFRLHRAESPFGYLRDDRIEVSDEARVLGVAGVLRPLFNVYNDAFPILLK
jgi:hypothetical protein